MSIVTALILIAALACVLVGGLELFAVTRIRDLGNRNAELLDRLDQREGELQDHERRLWELAPASEVEEVARTIASLRSAVEAMPARLTDLERELPRQREGREALEHRLRAVERSCARLGERLDDLERAMIERGALAQEPDPVAGPAFGEVTVRPALAMESAALRNVLVLLFEEYMAGAAKTRVEPGEEAARPRRLRSGLRRGDPNVLGVRHVRRRGARPADPA